MRLHPRALLMLGVIESELGGRVWFGALDPWVERDLLRAGLLAPAGDRAASELTHDDVLRVTPEGRRLLGWLEDGRRGVAA